MAKLKYYIEDVDKSLYTKDKKVEDVEKIAYDIWIQFGVNLFEEKGDNKYNVTDFTWSTKAKKNFYKHHKKIIKKMIKDKIWPWVVLQVEPKDENPDEVIDLDDKMFK